MKIQMTRSDWEKAGDYWDCLNCPGATMIKRITGWETVMSVSSTSYKDYKNTDRRCKTSDAFDGDTYKEAMRRYNAGEEVLFETTLIQ